MDSIPGQFKKGMWVKGNKVESRLASEYPSWARTHTQISRQRAPGQNQAKAGIKAKLLGE